MSHGDDVPRLGMRSARADRPAVHGCSAGPVRRGLLLERHLRERGVLGKTCFNGAGVGAACMVDADCQPAAGLVCSAGSCTLVTVTSTSCSSDQDCAAGSYCSLSGSGSGGCVPKKPAGALCDNYDECWGGCEVISRPTTVLRVRAGRPHVPRLKALPLHGPNLRFKRRER